MPQFFLHLHECGKISEDREGSDCSDLEEAVALATTSARDVMAWELRSGKLCLGCHIAIGDEAGAEVARVRFRDVVAITG